MKFHVLALFLATRIAAGCSSENRVQDTNAKPDGACRSDAECVGDGIVCQKQEDGSERCGMKCVSDWPDSFVCINGHELPCSDAGPEYCETCGCPEPLRCAGPGSCVERSDVGESCSDDSDCKTLNCSEFTNVCRVAIGQACSADDCDRCESSSAGWSYCSRECDWLHDCTSGLCLGNPVEGYHCTLECSSLSDESCPGQCRYVRDSTDLYCECDDCTLIEVERPMGKRCHYASHCESDSCYARSECGLDGCEAIGYCSKDCDSNADCAAGLACVEVPCTPEETGTCGNKCLVECAGQGCEIGECRSLLTVARDATSVCDIKLGGDATCQRDSDCQSGKCVTERCSPTDGVVNGGKCTLTSDCASNNCVSGTCRGNGVLGDSCAQDFDCTVGSCCPSGADTTCQESC